MLTRILKFAGLAAAGLILVGLVLYAFGLRIVLDGGGSLSLRFVESERARTARLARHREGQRAAAAAGAPAAVDAPAQRRPEEPPVPPPDSPAAAEQPAAVTRDVAVRPPVPAEPPPYWTGFRGPNRDGHYRERPVVTDWPADGLAPIWKQPAGGGYASFAIARGRAFTIEQRGPEEVVAAYDVATGHELWTAAWTAAFREFMGGDGPRATPAWADGRVYALGALGELRSLDEATGETLWRTNILEDAGAANLQWGMAASPLVVDDIVLVLPGGGNGRSVVAYDRHTGRQAWSALDDKQAYSSPMLVTLAGVRQLLVFSASRLTGLSPEGGEVLWEYPWTTSYDVNASQPLVVGEDRVFVSTGYGRGAAVIELSAGAGGFSVREVWRNIRMKNQFSSSVLHEGFVYGLDGAILACVDVATGDLRWKGGRYGYGQIVLADGHIVVVTEGGDLALVRATPERHEEVARFPVLSGKTWNHPAMADGILLVRNLAEMAAFDLRARN